MKAAWSLKRLHWSIRAILYLVVTVAAIWVVLVANAQRIERLIEKYSWNDFQESQESATTKYNLEYILLSLKNFQKYCHVYPTTAQGLSALQSKPGDLDCPKYPQGGFLRFNSQINDGYGNSLRYFSDGQNFRIEGPDGHAAESPGR